jgi:hypothetical protein
MLEVWAIKIFESSFILVNAACTDSFVPWMRVAWVVPSSPWVSPMSSSDGAPQLRMPGKMLALPAYQKDIILSIIRWPNETNLSYADQLHTIQ